MEVEVRVRNQVLTIGGEDATVAVVDVGVLELLAGGSVQLDALGGDGLPGSEGVRAGFDSVGGSDELMKRRC